MMTPEGGLFESNAIARYVARQGDAKLLGTTNFENVRPRTTLATPGWAGSGCINLLQAGKADASKQYRPGPFRAAYL